MNVVFLGPPGAGKGTQAARVSACYGIPHIATGDMLREAIARGTELGRLARSYVDRGELVPDEVMLRLVEERLREPDARGGFLLDGFPRTRPQAEGLDALLDRMGRRLDLVVFFRVPQETLLRRLGGRWICRAAGHVYHEDHHPPRVPGRCDLDGSELYQRPDDRPEAVARRLEVYERQTAPLVEYYRARGVFREVDGAAGLEEVTRRLCTILDEARTGRA
ncbi:MAG: adenylate kinase [Armatimonadota bacterium]|nr:adenylate kinase [Armatimonadota bacterium]MDR7443071.1 adenylate kinase [Armatimonadota bacterium]MDR7571134.1 adenylate kinase [Armatimonadota bacterium]MDR7614475.1 adenylate kinase [Armatimonadota bacterium]